MFLVLAAAGCAKQAPQVHAPKAMFDLSRICDDPHYGAVCEQQTPAAFPATSPIRVDTNLATPRSAKLALRG